MFSGSIEWSSYDYSPTVGWPVHAPHKRNSEAVADKVAEKQQHFVNPHDKAFVHLAKLEIGNFCLAFNLNLYIVYVYFLGFGQELLLLVLP